MTSISAQKPVLSPAPVVHSRVIAKHSVAPTWHSLSINGSHNKWACRALRSDVKSADVRNPFPIPHDPFLVSPPRPIFVPPLPHPTLPEPEVGSFRLIAVLIRSTTTAPLNTNSAPKVAESLHASAY